MHNPEVKWIDDSQTFAELAQSWRSLPYLALDTEFERRTTYYPKFALLQIYDGQSIYLIDPLKVECCDAFREIMADPKVDKILHSVKEDLEVLFYSWQCQLQGLFDTQVAYAFTNGEASMGYARMVAELCDITLAKEATQSDWLKRPLSAVQLDYAAKDVLYLPFIYQQLKERLAGTHLQEYFQRECSELCLGAENIADFEQDYRSAKEVDKLTGEQLAFFKALYQWREETAIKDDRTRNHIAKDGILVEIARICPQTLRQLQSIKDLHPRSVRHYGELILTMARQFVKSKPAALKPISNPRDLEDLKPFGEALVKIVQELAKEKGLNSGLLASKRTLRRLALAHLCDETLPANWKGWRRELLEPYLKTVFEQYTS